MLVDTTNDFLTAEPGDWLNGMGGESRLWLTDDARRRVWHRRAYGGSGTILTATVVGTTTAGME